MSANPEDDTTPIIDCMEVTTTPMTTILTTEIGDTPTVVASEDVMSQLKEAAQVLASVSGATTEVVIPSSTPQISEEVIITQGEGGEGNLLQYLTGYLSSIWLACLIFPLLF
jgi:hypothetical protein